MKELLRKKFSATATGSLPHTDKWSACKKILSDYKEIPFWPQMPKRAFLENMYAQFSEGLPCAVIDENKKKIWVDTSSDFFAKLEKTYQKIIDVDCEYFAITKNMAEGFHEFLKEAKAKKLKPDAFLKGHVTGPISFGLSVTDEKKQAILYRPELAEVLTKIMAIKARYEIRKLKKVSDRVIIFIDEPYLVSIGSSVVNIGKEDAIAKINEIISAIHEEGALAGIHCCGNTDWAMLLGLRLDILNFDAYSYSQSLSLYPDAVNDFLKRGNFLAWGIVPTSDELKKESVDTLIKKLDKSFSYLIDKGVQKNAILESAIITPSCGCGTLSTKDAEHVLKLNIGLSKKLKEIYGR